jgi:hypothetical protein
MQSFEPLPAALEILGVSRPRSQSRPDHVRARRHRSPDAHGLLSIRTPGNLVLQNSASYATLESIEARSASSEARIEAVTVRCAEACFVRGHRLAGDGALDPSRNGAPTSCCRRPSTCRSAAGAGGGQLLVGEGALPAVLALRRPIPRPAAGVRPRAGAAAPAAAPAPRRSARATAGGRAQGQTSRCRGLDSLLMLERDAREDGYSGAAPRALEQIAGLLRDRDLETLRATHRRSSRVAGRATTPGEPAS